MRIIIIVGENKGVIMELGYFFRRKINGYNVIMKNY